MNKVTFEKVSNPILVDTNSLKSYLNCGTATAIKLGNEAKAKIQVGRRVLWNLEKIKQYTEAMSE